MATQSRCRLNYHTSSEALVNKQINMELYASYVYSSMYAHFSRDDVALHGFAKFFKDNSDEERAHAFGFVEYQNKRGGRVVFHDIAKPSTESWKSPQEALNYALELEKSIHKSLLELHKTASDTGDAHLTDFVEGKYLDEQVHAENELANLITKAERAGDGLGIHIIDKELLS